MVEASNFLLKKLQIVRVANSKIDFPLRERRMAVMVSATATAAAVGKNLKNGEKDNKIVRIQVSKTKKPLTFYLNLAKRCIKHGNDVDLCALGMAIPTVIIISEILKRNGWAIEKNILTSTVAAKEDKEGRVIQKAKIEIILGKARETHPSTVAETCEEGADKKAVTVTE